MTQKTFHKVRVATAFLLAAMMAQAVVLNNYILAAIAVIGAIIVVLAARKKVSEVMVDERVLSIGGRAARFSMSIFSIAGAAITLVLMFFRNANSDFETAGSVLGYAVCALLLLYSAAFKYYEKQD